MLLDTAIIDEQILATLSERHKVTIQNSAPVTIMKQDNVSASTALRKENTQNANVQTHYEMKEDQRFMKRYWEVVRVAKQALLELLSVASVRVITKAEGVLFCESGPILSPNCSCLQKVLLNISLVTHSVHSLLAYQRRYQVLKTIKHWEV